MAISSESVDSLWCIETARCRAHSKFSVLVPSPALDRLVVKNGTGVMESHVDRGGCSTRTYIDSLWRRPSVVEPSPTWPWWLRPQHFRTPVSSTAQVCCSPKETEIASEPRLLVFVGLSFQWLLPIEPIPS